MKPLLTIFISVVLSTVVSYTFLHNDVSNQIKLGSTVISTATSDTLDTFRTNVNSSLTSLQNDKVSTTTAYSWTALQSFFAGINSNTLSVGATATTTMTAGGKLGIASTSPLGNFGIGTGGATSTISGGYFCSFFQDETGRGMWIKLSISGNTVFSTSTSACN